MALSILGYNVAILCSIFKLINTKTANKMRGTMKTAGAFASEELVRGVVGGILLAMVRTVPLITQTGLGRPGETCSQQSHISCVDDSIMIKATITPPYGPRRSIVGGQGCILKEAAIAKQSC